MRTAFRVAAPPSGIYALAFNRRYGPPRVRIEGVATFVIPIQPHYHNLMGTRTDCVSWVLLTAAFTVTGCESAAPPAGSNRGGAGAGAGGAPGTGGMVVAPRPESGGTTGGGAAGTGGSLIDGTGGFGTGGSAMTTGGAGGTATGGATGTTAGGAGGTATAGTGGRAAGGAGGIATGGAGGTTPNRAEIYANFDNGTSLSPFTTCWAWAPNYARVVERSVEFFYSQAAYDADQRRERRGTEICAAFDTFTDGWYGFKLLLPSPGFPTNSTTIITQVFQKGACNSWGAHLDVVNRDLVVQHRSSCGTPTEAVVYPNLPFNTWIPIVMYFKASNNGNGAFRVWVNGAPKDAPNYDRRSINFGFGQWTNGTTLAPGNSLSHKMGMYTQSGGDKRLRFDEISLQTGNPPDAYERVSPRP